MHPIFQNDYIVSCHIVRTCRPDLEQGLRYARKGTVMGACREGDKPGVNRSRVVVSFQLLLLAAASIYSASYHPPVTNRFGHTGLTYLQSATTLGKGRLVVGGYGDFSADRGFVHQLDGDTTYDPALSIFNAIPSIGYGITGFLDLSLSTPLYWDFITSESDTFGLSGLRGGFGDIELAGKFQYPPYPHSTIFEVAFFGALSLPTGTQGEGRFPRHTYYLKSTLEETDTADIVGSYTSTVPEMDMKMLWTLDLNNLSEASPVLMHLNFGARFTFHSQLDNIFLLNLGFEYHPALWLTLFSEFSGETRMSNVKSGFKLGEDPLRLSPGISFSAPGGFFLTLGGSISLSADTSLMNYLVDAGGQQRLLSTGTEPRWKLAVNVGWAGFVLPQDEDRDGIKDNVDRCPKDPEDFDGFEDSDGCPDTDNDNDGIPDVKDKCPNDTEDRDGFEDEDGCPDLDNDEDGVPDLKDQCPNVAEDVDGFEDDDGCPDEDNDMDAVPDTSDECPVDAEDRDGFRDHDGCPDFDNDQDGVPDSLDKCPDTKGVPENNGCPKEKPKPKEIKRGRVVLRGVNFEFGSAVLTGDSYAILERVYESLREWPEIEVEIRGHTDSVGSDEANQILSRKRAEAVRNYLVARGIDPSRLRPIGFGESEPIAENTTAEGRALNRRVELHRID